MTHSATSGINQILSNTNVHADVRSIVAKRWLLAMDIIMENEAGGCD